MDLTTTKLTLTELYTITTMNGDTARFTSHDADITYGANLYQAIPIKRSQISYHTDLQVDRVDISMGLVAIVIGDLEYSIPKVIRLGLLRNAHVYIHLVDYVALDSVKLLFEGWVTQGATYNRGICTLGVGSILDKLQEKFPKYIYSELCQHQLYGTYCGLDPDDYEASGTIDTGTTSSTIYADAFLYSATEEGWYAKGKLSMTSGDNSGVDRSILVHGDGYVRLLIPFIETLTVGDTFNVWPGCDKSGVMCDEKFDNYDNFFGFEYCPKPEVLIGG